MKASKMKQIVNLLLFLLCCPLLLAFTYRSTPVRTSTPLCIRATFPVKPRALRAGIGDLLPGVDVGAILRKMARTHPHDEQEYFNAMAEAGTENMSCIDIISKVLIVIIYL